jgi:peptide/nickel transport system substrate-binding protein
VGGGLAALSLVGCGGGDDGDKESGQSQQPAIDSTKGNPGGKLVMQNISHHFVNLVIRATPGTNTVMGLVHSGLLAYAYGRPPSNGLDALSEPDLAEALPEQLPDQLSYRFKLRPNAQFHNGRTVTAEDVKYSIERAAFNDGSTVKTRLFWLDKIDAPDATTVVVKTKFPFADTIQGLTADWTAFILAKEFEESPEATTKMMGSGPFICVSDQPPVVTQFRKNPNYYLKPYPYFDEITLLGSSDTSKKLADFASRQTQVPYWFNEQDRDEIKRVRPDAQQFFYPGPGLQIYMRVDQDPFKDKRIRQALSMAINRKAIRDAVSKGEGEADKILSHTHGARWGFRKIGEMGAVAKYWEYDPAESLKLMNAAGAKLPLQFNLGHWDVTATGQVPVDSATLTQAHWRQAGVANVTLYSQNIGQSASTIQIGAWDGAYLFQNAIFSDPGTYTYRGLWSPPEGPKVPTNNYGYVNNPELNSVLEKQLGQFNHEERKQTLRRVEDIVSDEMYRIFHSTYSLNYFADPNVKNIVVPYFRYAGSAHYVKYWWFDKA